MTLFTYCIPYDDGAAPNPFWGVCTLVICKPMIRRAAKVGDWIVGTGATGSPGGVNSVVYAAQVTRKISMKEYDAFCQTELRAKVPDWHNQDHRRRLGDSIYDFSADPPIQRQGVHLADNRATDLKGEYALLSYRFYYFGDSAVPLPDSLAAIVKHGQGHRGAANDPHAVEFMNWIDGLGLKANTLLGKPQLNLFENEALAASCAKSRQKEAEQDEELDAADRY